MGFSFYSNLLFVCGRTKQPSESWESIPRRDYELLVDEFTTIGKSCQNSMEENIWFSFCYSSPFLTEQNPNSESLLYYTVGLSNGIVSSVADNQAVPGTLIFDCMVVLLFQYSPFVVSDFLVTDIDQKLQPTLAAPRDPKLSTQPQDSSAGDSGGGWGQRRAVKPIEENVNVGTIDGIEISWSFASEDFQNNPSTFRCSRRRWWSQGTCKEIENVTQAQPPCTIKRHLETRWNEHQQNYPPSAACWESNWISNQRVDSFVLTL